MEFINLDGGNDSLSPLGSPIVLQRKVNTNHRFLNILSYLIKH